MSAKIWTVAGLLAAGVPAAALAADSQGLYLGGGGGLNLHEKSTFTAPAPVGNTSVTYDPGFVGLGAVGYAFGGGPRFEFEIGYRENQGKASAGGVAVGRGKVRSTSFMGNLLYDFDTGTALTPYVGAGLGGAFTDVQGGDSNFVFAFQGIVGAGYEITRNLDAFVDYRYFGTEKLQQPIGGTSVGFENYNHSVLLGVRYSFGERGPSMAAAAPMPPARGPAPAYVPAPAAPPPVAEPIPAATAMARSYLVFFDFAKAALTAEAQRIVRTAAINTREAAVTRIDVTGHTDRAGSPAYNMKLSQQRALAVKRELMANGVNERDIIVYAKGETEPLVPTRDGVREPQNRRVEIVLK